jgi:hypothetical protein
LTPTTDHHDALALVAGMLPDERLALLHLISCRRCGSAAVRELAATVRDELAALVAPSPRQPVITEDQVEAILVRSEAAARHARELAAMPAGGAREAIAADPQLRDPLVATSLLFDAESALEDPALAARLGEAAFAIVSSQDADAGGRNLAKLCRALWTIIRSARVQGRIEQAEEAFRRGLPFLGAAPPVSEDRAALLAAVAQLRWTERRLDEAAALFAQAARMFGELAERQGEAACRAQAGCVLVEQLDPWRARTELAVAHLHVDTELAPAFAARVALMLAWCNFAVGRLGEGRKRLRAARGLYAGAPGAGEEALRAWWEARIAALDRPGEQDGEGGQARAVARADAQLEAVRRRLLAEGSIAEAARCSLDLLVLRVEAGRLDAVSELGPDVLRGFQNAPGAFRPAEMIDWLAILAIQRSTRFPAALAATRHYLSGRRTHPRERPDLIADVQVLADRLLVAARPERRAAAEVGKLAGEAEG